MYIKYSFTYKKSFLMGEFLIKQIYRVLSIIIKIFLVRLTKEIHRSHRGIKAIEILLQTPLSLFILSF